MNYIPGFSNYLQASVPRYAKGGPARFAGEDVYEGEMIAPLVEQQYLPAVQPMTQEAVAPAAAPYVEPYQSLPAAQPMTQEAAAPYDLGALAGLDLSGLDSLYGMNFGTDFGGGAMGGQYEVDPNLQYVSAPLSNKGNATSQTGGNTFAVKADQPVRLVDHRTNQVVFEGSGFDAARKATELGQGLTDAFGRKANYSIQTADPTGNYSTVAYEKKNKSTLGKIADVAGTALPIAVSLIPGLQFLGPVASAALAGGAGAALKGDNILKGVAMGGLSAAGGQVLGPALGAGGALGTNLAPKLATAIGTGLGSTAGGLVTGQSLKNSLLGGVASGALSYVAPDIQRELGISSKSGSIFRGGDTAASTSTGDAVYGGPNADIIVNAPAFSTPNIKLGGFKTPTQKYLDDAASDEFSDPRTGRPYSSGYDGDAITVTGSVPGAVTGGLNLAGLTGGPAANNTDEIVVTGQRPGAVTSLSGLIADPAINTTDDIVVSGKRPGEVTDSSEQIVVTGNKIERPVTGGLNLSQDLLTDANQKSEAERKAEEERKKLGLEEYLRLAGLASGLIGGAAGGSGQTSRYGGAGGTSRLNPIFSAKLPSAGGLGNIGMNRTLRPLGDVDWLTYGTRPELSFFDYSPRTASTPVTTPAPGNPAGPNMAADRLVGTPAQGDYSMYAPEYRPAMYVPDDMRFAEGGAFAAKRGGPSKRTEFAVNGPGTGRSDDIPAVLSDGEYVIDAETVALLGDGSSKAGAKKLDDLRVKVRKHKGKKLAKGRFSANAKNPEAYLSGGRV
jgi:hypothetical protein